jgi:hypothetical protein
LHQKRKEKKKKRKKRGKLGGGKMGGRNSLGGVEAKSEEGRWEKHTHTRILYGGGYYSGTGVKGKQKRRNEGRSLSSASFKSTRLFSFDTSPCGAPWIRCVPCVVYYAPDRGISMLNRKI